MCLSYPNQSSMTGASKAVVCAFMSVEKVHIEDAYSKMGRVSSKTMVTTFDIEKVMINKLYSLEVLLNKINFNLTKESVLTVFTPALDAPSFIFIGFAKFTRIVLPKSSESFWNNLTNMSFLYLLDF